MLLKKEIKYNSLYKGVEVSYINSDKILYSVLKQYTGKYLELMTYHIYGKFNGKNIDLENIYYTVYSYNQGLDIDKYSRKRVGFLLNE